jgi:hypothetical protein
MLAADALDQLQFGGGIAVGARNEQGHQRRSLVGYGLPPVEAADAKAEEPQLLDQAGAPGMVFGGDQPDGARLGPLGAEAERSRVAALFLVGAGRQHRLDGADQGIDLALQGSGVLRVDRVGRFVAEEAQGRVLHALALAQQAGQAQPVELLGEVVQRQGEFDEVLETAQRTVFLPACLERAQAGSERALLRRERGGGFVFHGKCRIMEKAP